MKFIILLLSVLTQFSTISTAFKTVDLCPEKLPQSGRSSLNTYKMRDLLTKSAKSNEIQQGNEERSHVGNKTPVLGSTDTITYPGHDAGLLSTIYEAYNYHYNLRTGHNFHKRLKKTSTFLNMSIK